MLFSIIAIICLLFCVFVSRMVYTQAMNSLSNRQKGSVMHQMAFVRRYQIFPLLGLLFLYYILVSYLPAYHTLFVLTYIVAIVVYLVVLSIQVRKKLSDIALPEKFPAQYLLSEAIKILGFGLFVVILLLR